jgi:hypothetical protein
MPPFSLLLQFGEGMFYSFLFHGLLAAEERLEKAHFAGFFDHRRCPTEDKPFAQDSLLHASLFEIGQQQGSVLGVSR